MSIGTDLHRYKRAFEESAAWRLLHSHRPYLALAVLKSEFADSTSTVSETALICDIAIAFEDLVLKGDVDSSSLPDPHALIRDLMDRDLLSRSYDDKKEVVYRLTGTALVALRIADELVEPLNTATDSRMNTLCQSIEQLDLRTDTDTERKRIALIAQRERIDRELEEIDAGGAVAAIDDERAVRDARDILALAADMQRDFILLEEDYENEAKELANKTQSPTGTPGEALKNSLESIKQIGSTERGRAFTGLYELTSSMERMETLEGEIKALLNRDFSKVLSREERANLLNVVENIRRGADGVNRYRQKLSRNLKSYIDSSSSRQDAQLKGLLSDALFALKSALEEGRNLQVDDMTAKKVVLNSVSRLRLGNPANSIPAQTPEVVESKKDGVSEEDLRAAIAALDINLPALSKKVNRLLHEHGEMSAAEAVGKCAENLSDAIGIAVLAIDHGWKDEGGADEFGTWTGRDGTRWVIRMPKRTFKKEMEHV